MSKFVTSGDEIEPGREPHNFDMKSDIYLSVIIPAFNEGKRIGRTLRTIDSYFRNEPYLYEIIVVDDGSTDDTRDLVKGLTASIRHLSCMGRKDNRGKGYTVREGMLHAGGKIRLFTDADNSTDISHFDAMKPFFDEGYDLVVGSRSQKDAPGAGQTVSQPPHKRFFGSAGNLMIRKFVLPRIWDTQNGFKAFRNHAATDIFSMARVDGWGFDIEALALARNHGYRMGFIPVRWVNHPESRVRFTSYFEVFFEAVRVRRNLARGAYR